LKMGKGSNSSQDFISLETKAILSVYGRKPSLFVDLYLPFKDWRELVKFLNGNRLEVVLRSMSEYTGKLRLEGEG